MTDQLALLPEYLTGHIQLTMVALLLGSGVRGESARAVGERLLDAGLHGLAGRSHAELGHERVLVLVYRNNGVDVGHNPAVAAAFDDFISAVSD